MSWWNPWSKPVTQSSGIQAYLDSNLVKSARTPAYDRQMNYGGVQKKRYMEPPIDQVYLEYLATNYSHLKSVIERISSQTVIKGWNIEPRVDNPSDDQKEIVKDILNDPTRGDSDVSGLDLVKAIVRQVEVFDDAWVSVVYDLVKDEMGTIIGRKVKQLWVEDTKKIRYKTDRFGRFQTEETFCQLCRNGAEGTHCLECGTKLVPIAYVHLDQKKEIPFARDEMIHLNKYSSAARLYGESPIIGLAKKIETGLAIENYQNKLFRYERTPKGVLNIPGFDFEGLSEFTEYMQEQTASNPNYIPIVSTEGRRSDEVQFIHMMSGNAENKMLAFIDRVNQDINAAYGMMPLGVSDFRDTAGLYSEREQITMMDRTVRATQDILEMGFFEPSMRLMGITDWRIELTHDEGRQENQRLKNLSAKVYIMGEMAELGIKVGIDAEEKLIFPQSMDDWHGPERNTKTQWVPKETTYRGQKEGAKAPEVDMEKPERRGEPGEQGGGKGIDTK